MHISLEVTLPSSLRIALYLTGKSPAGGGEGQRPANQVSLLIGRLVFTVEQPQTPFELFLLGHESRGKNVIDDRVESPKLFERHAFKRLSFHESPRLTNCP